MWTGLRWDACRVKLFSLVSMGAKLPLSPLSRPLTWTVGGHVAGWEGHLCSSACNRCVGCNAQWRWRPAGQYWPSESWLVHVTVSFGAVLHSVYNGTTFWKAFKRRHISQKNQRRFSLFAHTALLRYMQWILSTMFSIHVKMACYN